MLGLFKLAKFICTGFVQVLFVVLVMDEMLVFHLLSSDVVGNRIGVVLELEKRFRHSGDRVVDGLEGMGELGLEGRCGNCGQFVRARRDWGILLVG